MDTAFRCGPAFNLYVKRSGSANKSTTQTADLTHAALMTHSDLWTLSSAPAFLIWPQQISSIRWRPPESHLITRLPAPRQLEPTKLYHDVQRGLLAVNYADHV